MSFQALRRTALKQYKPVSFGTRSLAIPSSSKTDFSRTLDTGPSLDDFISENVPEKVVLGNAKACVHCPLTAIGCNLTQCNQSTITVIPQDYDSKGRLLLEH